MAGVIPTAKGYYRSVAFAKPQKSKPTAGCIDPGGLHNHCKIDWGGLQNSSGEYPGRRRDGIFFHCLQRFYNDICLFDGRLAICYRKNGGGTIRKRALSGYSKNPFHFNSFLFYFGCNRISDYGVGQRLVCPDGQNS